MADSSDMVVRIGADLTDLTRDFQRGVSLGKLFGQDLEKAAAAGLVVPRIDANAFRVQGTVAGRALAEGMTAQVRDASGALAGLTADVEELGRAAAGLQVGTVRPRDVDALRQLVVELRGVAQATAGADQQLLVLDTAFRAMNDAAVSGATGLRDVERLLSNVERTAQRLRSLPSGRTLAGSTDSLSAGRTAAAEAERQAATVARASEQERQARAQARAELLREIPTLALYGRTVQATNAQAVEAWRREAAAIRQQATELRLPREAMLRLDVAIQAVERSFERAQRQAARLGQSTSTMGGDSARSIFAVNQATGRFTESGTRAASAAVSVAFALEAVATSASGAEGGMKTALRAVAAFAAPFGPQGLIVAGVAGATAALLDFAKNSSAAEQAAKAYATELERVRGTAASASDAILSLSASQSTQRRFSLNAELEQARTTIGELRKEMAGALDINARGFEGGFTLNPRLLRDLPLLQSELRGMVGGLRTGTVSGEAFAVAIARIGDRHPEIRQTALEFLGQAQALQAAEAAARRLGLQIDGVTRATRQPGGVIVTGLQSQIADQRALNAAVQRGGTVEREAFQTAAQAFAQWRAQRTDLVGQTLTLSDALRSQNVDVREHAEAFLRDARELAKLSAAGREAESAIDRLRKSAANVVLRVQVLAELGAPTELQARAVSVLGDEFVRVTELVEAQGGPLKANAETVQTLVDLTNALGQAATRALEGFSIPIQRVTPSEIFRVQAGPGLRPVEIPFTASQVLLRAEAERALAILQQRLDQLGAAQIRLDVARTAGQSDAIRTAERDVQTLGRSADQAAAAVAGVTLALPTSQQADIMGRVSAAGAKVGRDFGKAQQAVASFADTMQALSDATRGVLGLADAFGTVDDSLRRTIDNVANLLDSLGGASRALEQIRKTDPSAGFGALFSSVQGISSLIGIIGSAAGVIAGLLDNPAERERAALVRQNNEELRRLSASLSGFGRTAAAQQDVFDALRSPELLEQAHRIQHRAFESEHEEAKRRFTAELSRLGLSWTELLEVAQQRGIDITTDDGNVFKEGLLALRDAIELASRSLTQFGRDLSDQRTKLELRDALFGPGGGDALASAVATITREMDLLANLAPRLAGNLGDLDANTAEGRAAIAQGLRDLFTRLANNQITLTDLQDLADWRELVEIIRNTDGALDQFTDATDGATDAVNQMTQALSNVPQGFKRAIDQIRFDVTPVRAITVPTPTATPTLPTGGRLGTPQERDPVVLAPVYQLGERSIVIDAGSRSAADLLDEIDAELGRRARTGPGGVSNPMTGGVSGLIYRLPTLNAV